MLHGGRQLRENRLIQQLCELGQIAGRIRLMTNKGAGGRLYGIAPVVGLDQLDDELDLPLYLPQFMEAATFPIDPLRLSPLDADESQLVQQSTAGAVSVVTQVQVQLRAFWRRLEAQAALFCFQVALQGYRWCPRRYLAQPLADPHRLDHTCGRGIQSLLAQ